MNRKGDWRYGIREVIDSGGFVQNFRCWFISVGEE